MSDIHHAPVDDEAHTGPIKNPRQLMLAVVLAFVIPIFVIVCIVQYVTSGGPSANSAMYSETAVMARIQKVGRIELGDGSHTLKSGEDVFKAQCTTCHSAGLLGAPKFGDAAAWAPRIKTGYEALLNSALKGKNAMTPQAGGAFDTVEIGRAVVYMANAAGGKFEEPKTPAAAASAAAPAAATPPATPATVKKP
jgi:cytochrome c5